MIGRWSCDRTMFGAMIVSSPAEFNDAVAEHPFGEFDLAPMMLGRAASTLAAAGLLVRLPRQMA